MLSPVALMNPDRLCFLAPSADLIAKSKKLIAVAVLIGVGISSLCMDWGELSSETVAYQSSQSAPISAEGKPLLVHDMSNTLIGHLDSKELFAQISECIG